LMPMHSPIPSGTFASRAPRTVYPSLGPTLKAMMQTAEGR
jgi:hypothetical protein